MGDTLVRANRVDDLICFLLLHCGFGYAMDDLEIEAETDRQREKRHANESFESYFSSCIL